MGIWTVNFEKQMSDLKSSKLGTAPSKLGTDEISLKSEKNFVKRLGN